MSTAQPSLDIFMPGQASFDNGGDCTNFMNTMRPNNIGGEISIVPHQFETSIFSDIPTGRGSL